MSKTPRNDVADAGASEADALEHEEFLTRWSRRKSLAREGVELPEPVDEVAGDSEPPPGGAGRGNEDNPPIAAPELPPELPPIESLGEDSDYSAFLASDVPADLQRKALRKLFQSPKFNVRDGLDDYDLDFSSPEPLGDIVTAEMRHRLRAELERLAGLDDDEGAGGEVDQDGAPAKLAENEEQEHAADSEPGDDEPATA